MANFYDILVEVLKADKRFFTEDGTLLRNRVYEAALNMETGLIEMLLSNDETKKRFFVNVNGTLVFDKVAFGWVVNNRQFLPDSYTRFKNRIGLIDGRGDLISASNDVVLSFPYKDCVLEGGQTKDEQKRSEVFFNETLAPDEVDRLLYPKVLVGATRYSYTGETDLTGIPTGGDDCITATPAVDFSDSDNLLIKGNNLLAIASLLKRYEGKIDLIYLDPPYNTNGDSFRYNDSFNHSTWLVFMKNRLEIAKRLLSPTGSIYVQLDQNESHYFKVLLDEVFGVDNFQNEIIWRYSGWNKKNTSFFNRRHDNILYYSRTSKPYFEPYKMEWESAEAYAKARKQKILVDEETGRDYVLSDGGKGTRVKRFLDEAMTEGKHIDDVWMLDKLNNSDKEGLGFSTQKPERLIERIVESSCPPSGIVLDFHVGSGTTAAVAHKMGRRYIGVEQMDYIETITVERLKHVIAGDPLGISSDVNWHGGGSFVYVELAKYNQNFVDIAMEASDDAQLSALLKRTLSTGFISSNVNPSEIANNETDFEALSLEDKKRFIIELLDKNMLYVNLCDIDDEEYAISEADKAFTRSFYELEEK
ncbi:site-specific DNA-methyltransferase [Oscillibacter sp.]|jgi:adenine-specific DNA-methyltransferase|uniref:site-specific DNA-methyltransferase n=1 Tax=Oscillibacter sp. TaxID=1945593 RepID=UPI0028A0EC9C|nr:site-specific DNA-methyltransferase [Oscillibacter sp.]